MSSSRRERPPLMSSYQNYNEQDDSSTRDSDSDILVSTTETESEDEAGLRSGYNWGWVIVMASFYCVAIVGGVGYITGVLMESLETELQANTATISLAGSIQVAVYRLVGPLASKLTSKHGGHIVCMVGAAIASLGLLLASFINTVFLLIMFYSIVTGLGFGLMYIPSVVACVPYFTKRRSLAIGICLCGSGFGTFTLAPLSHGILIKYGWRWVMRALAGFSVVGILCGATMTPPCINAEDDINKGYFSNQRPRKTSIVRNVLGDQLPSHPRLFNYILFVLTDFLTFTSVYSLFTHLPSFAESQGVDGGSAAFLISIGGMTNTIGRLIGGAVCDLDRLTPLQSTMLSLILSVIPSIALPFCASYLNFVFAFGIISFFTGVVVGCTNPVIILMLGVSVVSPAFSLVSAMRGVAALLGPPLAGVLVDWSREPGVAMSMSAGVIGAGTLVSVITLLVDNRFRSRRDEYTQI